MMSWLDLPDYLDLHLALTRSFVLSNTSYRPGLLFKISNSPVETATGREQRVCYANCAYILMIGENYV